MSPARNTVIPSISILDIPVHVLDMETALDEIEAMAVSGKRSHVVTADSSMIVMARTDAALKDILKRAALVTPDSAGVLWAARRQQALIRQRVSGVEIVEKLCERSVASGIKIFFLGGAHGVAQQAADRMEQRYPGARIVGAMHGFFGDEETGSVIAAIQQARPDVLCVAFGIPRQEKWIARHSEALDVPVLMGVGGTLDVLSGNVKRAPRIMQRMRLEWLWRVASNPRKIGKVMLLPRFVMLVITRSRTAP